MTDGLFHLSPFGIVLYTLLLTHVTIAAVTIYLHRHQAHRALDLHPAVSHFFRFWLWLTTGMRTREWVAVHRKHHAHCESAEDPHSPRVVGLRTVLLRGVELYRAEADCAATLERYGRGTPDDLLERRLYTRYPQLGIGLMLAIDLLLLGPIGLSVWGIQMLWIPFWAAGVINGVGHAVGYRNFHTPDVSTNIVPWGILIGGEELHNNHHAYPGSAKFSARLWELDLGWGYIRLLAALRLARVKRTAPLPLSHPMAGGVDVVEAVVRHRAQVLARYNREVLVPLYRAELRHAADRYYRAQLKRAKRLLLWDWTLLDDEGRRLLRQLLEQSETLRTAYRLRERLETFGKRTPNLRGEKVCKALREWTHQAQASGISALEEFARRFGDLQMPGDSQAKGA